MQEQINQFFLKWNGAGLDFDHAFGFQCMDVFEEYNKDIIGGQPIYGDAIDVINKYDKSLYDFVENSPDNFPVLGDVVLWNNRVGQFGHIAICFDANSDHFVSFDQNYPVGTKCHFQSHNYDEIAGWLHPKANVPVSNTPVITDQTLLDTISDGKIEYQALKSLLEDRKNALSTSQNQVTAMEAKDKEYLQTIGDQGTQIASLQDQLKAAQSQPGNTTVIVHQDFIDWVKSLFKKSA